jgi:DMSO/TMAO reductase YedYZ molybdopterin-dependent catalytic subunit
MPFDSAAAALLAVRLNETNLSEEHGGPVRLVVPGGECFTSIKWLDHLELRSEPGLSTAETIASTRLSSSCDRGPFQRLSPTRNRGVGGVSSIGVSSAVVKVKGCGKRSVELTCS